MKYVNPVIPGFHPDPSICRAGEDYYLVTSSFEYFPGVPIFHSRDLIHWRQIGHCLTRKSQLNLEFEPSSFGIFAPTIRYHNGVFYMVTTNVLHGGNFLVYTNDPSAEWSEPIWIDQGGIDPSLLFDDDGRVYFTSNGRDKTNNACEQAGIYQCEIDIKTGRRLTESTFVWAGTGGASPEGPHLFKKDGIYFLLISEGGTELGHMCTIAKSESPFGPFIGYDENPILTHRSLNTSIKAVGHADLVQASDGSWWAVCLGIRPVGYPYKHHLGRETFLAPVKWDDGCWPIIGNNGTIALEMEADGLQTSYWVDFNSRDTFNNDRLDFCWNFLRNPYKEDWSLEDMKGRIVLNGSSVTLNDVDSPAFIGRRQEHFYCDVKTLLNFEPADNGEEAGLTVFLNERFHYEIAVACIDGNKCIIFRRSVGSLIIVESRSVCGKGPIILKISASPYTYEFSYSEKDDMFIRLGEAECSLLSTEVGGKFTGVFFGLYATGNGRHSNTLAYFDWFEYINIENINRVNIGV